MMLASMPTSKETFRVKENDEVPLVNYMKEEGASHSKEITAMEEYNGNFEYENKPLYHWADIYVVTESDDEELKEENKKQNKFEQCEQLLLNMLYQCQLCVYQSSYKINLKRHMLRKHTFINSNMCHICGFCGYQVTNISEELLTQHLEEEHFPVGEVTEPPKIALQEQDNNSRTKHRLHKRLSRDQVSVLKQQFQKGHYLNKKQKEMLAHQLNITEKRVSLWFNNRRSMLRKHEKSC